MYRELLRIFKLHNRLLNAHSFLPSLVGSDRAFPPLIVQLELTHRCNLNCPMCYQSRSPGPAGELSTAEWKKVLDGLPPWALVTLTGGDPFMRGDFSEIFAHAAARHKCNILTNGELLTDGQARLLVDGGLVLLGVSIDGAEAVHDALRRKKGLFGRVVANIKKIQAEKARRKSQLPLLDVKTVLLNENWRELPGLAALVGELGADFWSLSLPKLSDVQFSNRYRASLGEVFGSSPLKTCLKLSAEEERELALALEGIARNPGRAAVRFYPYNMLGAGPLAEHLGDRLRTEDFLPCRQPWSFACVSPRGEVFPCLSYRAGSVREKPFAEIWNGPEFRAFRAGLDRKKLNRCCLGCCYSVYRKRPG